MSNQNNQYYGNGQYNNQYNQRNQGGYYYSKGNNANQNQNQRQKNKFLLFSQYDQSNTNEEKNNKKNIIIIIICAVVFILLVILLFKGCSKKGEKLSCEEDYKAFGSDKYGYVCVPSDWVKFEDPSAKSGIRYSDINASFILTLDTAETATKSAEAYANEVKNGLEGIGLSAEITKTELKDYDAYKVTSIYKGENEDNNIYIVVYFFETSDEQTRYIGIEGLDPTDSAFKIPESFATKK